MDAIFRDIASMSGSPAEENEKLLAYQVTHCQEHVQKAKVGHRLVLERRAVCAGDAARTKVEHAVTMQDDADIIVAMVDSHSLVLRNTKKTGDAGATEATDSF
ncbi:hypothetical protein Ct61P_15142 [Colletotrichum tofieldiae]|nr:hypothetical protein Ct61P_15142 [Colletotrichum tofieldiae]